jgi:hypothetical protein
MSSTAFATPLNLELRPSRRLAGFLLAAHGGALALLPFTSLPLWAMITVGLAVLASLTRLLPRFATLGHPDAVTRLVWPAGDEWQLSSRGGQQDSGVLLPGAYVHPSLVILPFRTGRGRRSVPILPDMLDADSFRRLRVRLGLHAFDAPPGRDRRPL